MTLAVAHTDGQGIGLGALDTQNNIALFVGPEGGFAPSEIARFQAKNAVLLDFGTRILRTETVGMAAVFALRQG